MLTAITAMMVVLRLVGVATATRGGVGVQMDSRRPGSALLSDRLSTIQRKTVVSAAAALLVTAKMHANQHLFGDDVKMARRQRALAGGGRDLSTCRKVGRAWIIS